MGALFSQRVLLIILDGDDNLQLHSLKKLAIQNLSRDSKIPKARPFLYLSLYLSSSWVSHTLLKAIVEHRQTGKCDLVFTKHTVRFIPKYRQTHRISTAEHALIQCLPENFCWNPFYLCITNLCQDFILHFMNPLIPQTQTTLSLQVDSPFNISISFVSKKPDWGSYARCYATRIRQQRSYTHMFLTYTFLPIRTLHLGTQTRICCYRSLWRQTFSIGSN